MSIKIRTKTKDGVTVVSSMLRHPMETGRRKAPQTGELIPLHHITEVICELNGEMVMSAVMGAGVSKNPFFSFYVHDTKVGDILALIWLDNLGNTDTIKTVLK